MNSNKALLLALLLSAISLRAEDVPLIDGEKEADAAAPVHADDSAKVLKRFNFDAGMEGWNTEQDEEYKPWSKAEPTPGGFRGTGALKITGISHWGSLGAFIALEFPGATTHVTFAYRTTNCHSLIGQGKVAAIKKQLHGSPASFTDKAWRVETLEPEKWAPWSGNELGKAHTFSTIMLYSETKNPTCELLLDDVILWSGKDTTPPDKVRHAAGSVDLAAGEVVLRWSAPTDNIAVAKFDIHRSISPGFTPSAETLIGSTCDTAFRDGGLNNFGTYYYRLVAEDEAGNTAEPSLPLKIEVKE
jgi:hypothetical protein